MIPHKVMPTNKKRTCICMNIRVRSISNIFPQWGSGYLRILPFQHKCPHIGMTEFSTVFPQFFEIFWNGYKNIGNVRCSCCLSPKWTESQVSVTLWNIWRTVSKLAHTPWQNSENRLYYKHGHLKNFKIWENDFFNFFKVLKKLYFKLFEFFRAWVFPKPVENVIFNI